MAKLEEVAGSVQYPGRGLAIGRDVDGLPFAAYWLTGRTPASQSRELVVSDREIVVQDISGAATDDLRHYTGATRGDDWVIVGNGTQVGELTAARAEGVDLQLALRNFAYEPDPPIRTPRIFCAATLDGDHLRDVVAGSARSYAGDQIQHPSLHLAHLEPSTAIILTTYSGTAAEVVTDGIPRVVDAPTPWSSLADALWSTLDPAVRVALAVIPLNTPTFTHTQTRPNPAT